MSAKGWIITLVVFLVLFGGLALMQKSKHPASDVKNASSASTTGVPSLESKVGADKLSDDLFLPTGMESDDSVLTSDEMLVSGPSP